MTINVSVPFAGQRSSLRRRVLSIQLAFGVRPGNLRIRSLRTRAISRADVARLFRFGAGNWAAGFRGVFVSAGFD